MDQLLNNLPDNPGSPLAGKRLLFLGSSVTRGYASDGISMADILQTADRCIVRKEAVDGTTLADVNDRSYLHRLLKLNAGEAYDCVICQFSTNDASQNLPLGILTNSKCHETFDTSTILGSLEAIISYVGKTWACPFVLYTSPRFSSKSYEKMMMQIPRLKEKWGITVIDLWNNEQFNQLTPEERIQYMADPIHPTREGYFHWFTPAFQKALYAQFEAK